MSAGEETARTVLSITSKATLMTMKAILDSMKRIKNVGEQSLHSLSSKNVSIDKIPVSSVDIRNMRQILKEYGVDFSVVKDKATSDFTLYFKATDTAIITSAFEEIIKEHGLDKDNDLQSDLTEQDTEPIDLEEKIKGAEEKAEQITAEKAAERAAERNVGDLPKSKVQEQSL